LTGGTVSGINIYVRPDSVDGLNGVAGRAVSNVPGSSATPQTVVPINGALIVVKNAANGSVSASATTGPDGSFAARGLPPGNYDVIFQKEGMITASVPVSLSYVNNEPTTVSASAQMANA